MSEKTYDAVFPFFWQCGANQEEIRTELEKIYQSNLRAFCVEARPHPDFGGERWWADMDLIMGFARKRGMQVWLLDDDRFPTGHANKAFSDGNNPLSVRFLTVHNTDVAGPRNSGYMLVKGILKDNDRLVGVLACKRKDEDSTDLVAESFLDLTDRVKDGWLHWDVPEGLWRILVFYTTRHGNGKLDYFNILDSRSVKLLIDRVYEPHYEHYGKDFGKTFQGFFSDEPEFSNLPGYRFQARLGEDMPYIPWSDELEERLKTRWGGSFLLSLPALWYQIGKETPHIRYEYMDETTRQLSVSFSGQIGDWCREHGVVHIGHIVEDDNSHGRLGCSTGHYFRSLSDMRMAGIDVVTQQIMPGMIQGEHQWVASSRDGEFFHFGLAKMGSSLAHIDPKKKGDSMCEIFGAFGWQEGVGLMKWLADHMLSRGINHFVPHAFSVKPYPDPDCPPHFYAHGNNPQYGQFGRLMSYLRRSADVFRGGWYPARTAVLYHADAEWAGGAMLFQKPVRTLLEHQMDADVIPADVFAKENPYGADFQDGIRLSGQRYDTLVIPFCEFLPLSVAEFLEDIPEGIRVLFVDGLPKGICERTDREAELLSVLPRFEVAPLSELAGCIRKEQPPLLELEETFPWLRTYPYFGKDKELRIFCFNESVEERFEGSLSIHYCEKGKNLYVYDAMEDCYYRKKTDKSAEGTKTKLCLEAGEALILTWKEDGEVNAREEPRRDGEKLPISGKWEIFFKNVKEDSFQFLAKVQEEEPFPDLTGWAAANQFCGTLCYRTEIRIPKEKDVETAGLWLPGNADCAEILVNGKQQANLIGSPRLARISLTGGCNKLEIRLPLTPVWKDGDPWSALTVLPRMDLTERPVLLPE